MSLEENEQTGRRWQEVCSNSNLNKSSSEPLWAEPHVSKNIKPSGWTANNGSARDDRRFQSCQLRARIWGRHGQRLSGTGWPVHYLKWFECTCEYGTQPSRRSDKPDLGNWIYSGEVECEVKNTLERRSRVSRHTYRGAIICTIIHCTGNNTSNITGESDSQASRWVLPGKWTPT